MCRPTAGYSWKSFYIRFKLEWAQLKRNDKHSRFTTDKHHKDFYIRIQLMTQIEETVDRVKEYIEKQLSR